MDGDTLTFLVGSGMFSNRRLNACLTICEKYRNSVLDHGAKAFWSGVPFGAHLPMMTRGVHIHWNIYFFKKMIHFVI